MIKSRQVAIAGLLSAITVILGITGLGFIPFPTLAGRATIMHIPVILAGIMEGPAVGMFTGLIFGLFSFIQAASPMTADPVVAILPRLFIGVAAWAVFRSFSRYKKYVAGSVVAAVAGTLVNTIGVLFLAVWRGYIPGFRAAGVIALTHGIPEVIVAGLLVMIVYGALTRDGKR